jgi:hypothetical protein
MTFSCRTVLQLAAIGWLGISTVSALNYSYGSSSSFNNIDIVPSDIINRDVVVVGGGASGTFTAVRLTDFNQSVIIVEEKNRLGGHTQTVFGPNNTSTDIGVLLFHDLPVVRNFFERFNISLVTTSISASGGVEVFANFLTGETLNNVTQFNGTAIGEAIGTYQTQLDLFPFLSLGYELPDPVPAELLMPTIDFIKKFGLEALAPSSSVFGGAQGFAHLLTEPVLYTMKIAGADILRSIETGFLTTPDQDNSALYVQATQFLGDTNVLLNSNVLSSERTGSGVELLVHTPSGPKLIRAKKLVLAIPPKLSNLEGFDLSPAERFLFGQFRNSGYYTGLVANSGINASLSGIMNIDPNLPDQQPFLPGIYGFTPSGIPGLQNVKYGSPIELPSSAVEIDILAALQRLQQTGVIDPNVTPQLQNFSNHSPFALQVSPEAIAAGFYHDINELQGQRNTFYTGATWETHDSSLIWNFTDTLLPRIVASLM